MVPLFFNELSVLPLCTSLDEARTRLGSYADLLLSIKTHIPNIEVRYQYSLFYTEILNGSYIGNVCLALVKEARKNSQSDDVNRFQYLLMSQHDPYIKEELDDSDQINYVLTKTFLKKNDNELIPVEGFKAAYFCNSICVGLFSEPYWRNHIHTIIIDNGSEPFNIDIACISKEEHLTTQAYTEWVDRNVDVELKESTKPIKKKLGQHRNAIGKHHGKELLYAHALKLIESPYVEEIITSAEYGQPSEKDYIAGFGDENGVIRIMLVWEEPKVSMFIKTTGRNCKETKAIADILRNQFAK